MSTTSISSKILLKVAGDLLSGEMLFHLKFYAFKPFCIKQACIERQCTEANDRCADLRLCRWSFQIRLDALLLVTISLECVYFRKAT
ncbi:hypothetical protein D918_08553 [Trichuris suis]|nr:hypothetical protein D918_08553 [Trichuris suis]